MDSGWTHAFLNWIVDNPGWAVFAIFLVSWVESLAIIGILLPGILILFGIGAMIGLGVLEFWSIWIAASAGAFLGDLVSFMIGYRLRGHMAVTWPFSRYPNILQRGIDFFQRHGSKSVMAGRFIGPLRPVIPATAGMLAMPPRRFLSVMVPACILWSPAYLLPGMLFGASLEVASEYAGRLSLVLVITVGVLWLTWWLMRGSYVFLVSRSTRWLRKVLTLTRRHPVFGRIAGPLLDPSQPELLSVSMLGLLLVLLLWASAMLLFLSPFSQQPQAFDQAVLALVATLRNHVADPVMVAINQLSNWNVLLPTAAAVLLWLMGAGLHSAASHWMVAMGGGAVLQFLLGWTLRATPLLQEARSEWEAGSALTMTTVVLGFFAIIVARELRRRSRQWPYLAVALLLSLLVVARIYLGLEWFSGAMVGLFLGLAWTAIVGIAYRQRAKLPFSGPIASLIFFGMLALTMNWQNNVRHEQDLQALRLPLPEREIGAQDWWERDWASLPRELNRFSSVAARAFNFQVAVPPAEVAAALAAQGWQVDESADWTWPIRSLNPDPDPASLPLLAKDHLGRPEVLRLRRMDGRGGYHTLRLWASGVSLQPAGQAVTMGQAAEEHLVRRLKLLYYWRSMPAGQPLLDDLAAGLGAFEMRSVAPGLLLVRERAAPLTPRAGSPAGGPAGVAAAAWGRPAPAAPASPAGSAAAVR